MTTLPPAPPPPVDVALRHEPEPQRQRFRVPGNLAIAVMALTSVSLLWTTSSPGGDFLLGMLALFVLAGFGFIWVVQVLELAIDRIRRRPLPERAWRLLIPPVGALLVWGLLVTDAPFQAGFAVSRGALDREADRALDAGDDYRAPGRVGLYEVHSVDRKGEAVFIKTDVGFSDCGFARLPDGPQPEFEDGSFERPRYRHRSGDWYTWCASW